MGLFMIKRKQFFAVQEYMKNVSIKQFHNLTANTHEYTSNDQTLIKISNTNLSEFNFDLGPYKVYVWNNLV